MQDLNDMLYFTEVVDAGGFAAAARRLGLPKSKLSRRVAELEGRLGVRLLQRTTRKLSLTDVGALYLRHCSAMRDAALAAQEAVEYIQTEPRGTIRVACPLTLALSTIGPLVPAFMNRYPQVRIDMRVSNRVVDLVEEGVDIALRVRLTLDDSASLVVKNFGQSRTLLVASPQQFKRQWQPQTPDQLLGLDTVGLTSVDTKATWVLRGPGGASHTLVHQTRYCADDLTTLRFAVLGGIGMCFMPHYMCEEDLQTGRLVEVLPGWNPTPGIFHAVYPTRRGM
ncbi:MAG: LysR substrate-binding domain-containing protein, partial [Rhodoferax sp.]